MTSRRGYTYNYAEWGGDYWRVAHCLTFLFPATNHTDGEKQLIKDFFHLFPYTLPCSTCGEHFQTEMRESPLSDDVLSTRDALTRWLHAIHNRVNARTGKAEITYDDVYRFFVIDSDEHRLPRTRGCPLNAATATTIGINPATIAVASAAFVAGVGLATGAVLLTKRSRRSVK